MRDPGPAPESGVPPWPPPHAYDNERQWLDCLLEREILRLRARYELSLDELRGLYISDRQVDQLLRQHAAEVVDSGAAYDPVTALTVQAAQWRAHFAADSPLALLVERLGLSEGDLEIVFIVFAPELDLRYETLYAYLNNDIGRKAATPDLVRRLLGGADRSALQAPFAAGVLTRPAPDEGRSTLGQHLALAEPAIQFLLGIPPAAALEAIPATAQGRAPAGELLACRASDAGHQAQWASNLLAARGLHGLHIAPDALAGTNHHVLLARIAGAALIMQEPVWTSRDPPCAARLADALVRALDAGLTVLWLVPPGWQPGPFLQALPLTTLDLPAPQLGERAAAWTSAIDEAELDGCGPPVARALSSRFSFGAERIHQAVRTARALLDADPGVASGAEALERVARQMSAQPLAQVAQHATKPHRWEQLVLPPTTLQLLGQVARAIAAREQVFRQWNMQGRTGRSSGLMLLFSGTSGTGKTMAASVLANHVGLDLFRIDLASVVSKYIGETEKNLGRIFAAAHDADAILLIDEADALLGKRAEVKDAHDRYANIEVAYLLQKMEDHDGVVILASNLPKNLDQAFARRMHYVVEFSRPGPALREQLWRGMFPPEVPLTGDIDYGFLAEQFELTGGDIQTIALEAAFLAAGEGSPVGMAQLMRAMARRQTKHGDPGVAARFRVHQDTLERGRV